MHPMMFVNLPVANVERSRAFFTDLGYAFNENFSNDQAVAVVLGENQFAFLIQTDFFDSLHPVATADARVTKECVVCLSVDSREAVDALVDRAIGAGGTPGDTEDHVDMYGRSYHDPDGHSWQIFWMDPQAIASTPKAAAATEV
jgi:predicted lactoylglutathione lyase